MIFVYNMHGIEAYLTLLLENLRKCGRKIILQLEKMYILYLTKCEHFCKIIFNCDCAYFFSGLTTQLIKAVYILK